MIENKTGKGITGAIGSLGSSPVSGGLEHPSQKIAHWRTSGLRKMKKTGITVCNREPRPSPVSGGRSRYIREKGLVKEKNHGPN